MSLADRITSPTADAPTANAPETNSGTPAIVTDAKKSWADELASPTGTTPAAPATQAAMGSTVEESQLDGFSADMGGSSLEEGDYEVEINLTELQQDASANNPLYSGGKTFENLLK